MRGIKKMKVTPIKMVNAHVRRRRPKYFLNFNGYTPLLNQQMIVNSNKKLPGGRCIENAPILEQD